MKLLKIITKSTALKIILIGLFFIIPTIKANAGFFTADWSGEIYIKALLAQVAPVSTNPDYIITGSTGQNAYTFLTELYVNHPAVDSNINGVIDSCIFCNVATDEEGSWSAVQSSEFFKSQNGTFYLFPSDTANASCRGGLCIQISTDKNFASSVLVTNPLDPTYTQIYPYLTPIVTIQDKVYSITVKGFSDGTKYYYRFLGEESLSSNKHYFPFNPFNTVDTANTAYYDGDYSNLSDTIKDSYSFTTQGATTGAFSIEIPPANITYNSAQIKIHTPTAQLVVVKLLNGINQIWTDTKPASAAIPDSASGGFYQLVNAGAVTTLAESTKYTVEASKIKDSVIIPTGSGGYDTIDQNFTTTANPVNITPPLPPGVTQTDYYPLASLPGVGENCTTDPVTKQTTCIHLAIACPYGFTGTYPTCVGSNVTGSCPTGFTGTYPNCVGPNSGLAFGTYLNTLIKIFIGICAILAMIMIVVGGLQYMTSELGSGKEAGRERITNAIIGLLIALGAFALLNTINPQLLNVSLNGLPTATITKLGEESTIDPTPIATNSLKGITGIVCPGNGGTAQLPAISNSFINHVTYDQTKRNTTASDNSTIYLDCSSFISQVYACAGLPSPGNTSAEMFNSGNAVTSVTSATAGDILGWKAGESTKYAGGHVFMSLGGDTIIEVSNPPGGVNKNAHTNSLTNYLSEIKHKIKAPY